MVFFKHFVESRGLKSLVGRIENWQKHKITDKSDNFLEDCMLGIYNLAAES